MYKMYSVKNYYLFCLLFLITITGCRSEGEKVTFQTICNPVNISYRFFTDGSCRRDESEPCTVLFEDEYYLFLSNSAGYFHSADFLTWNYISSPDLPPVGPGHTVTEIEGELWFTNSFGTNNIYKTADPKSGKWEVITDSFPYIEMDPMLFKNTDGKVFLYAGAGNNVPLTGVEIDKNILLPIGEQIPLIEANPNSNGWEVPGSYNESINSIPWLDGIWVNEYNGKYYLQYASPGRATVSYNTGVYVAENPLGPFVLSGHNPLVYKPAGFINGAGNGSTIQDRYGNYWYTGNSVMSKNHYFERRFSTFPVFFDQDDIMYSHTGFGDYPVIIPDKKVDSPEELFPGWMLLSYNKKTGYSSKYRGCPGRCAVDEDIRTWWSAETGEPGEYLSVDLGEKGDVYAIQINFADQDAWLPTEGDSIYYQYTIEESRDGKKWQMLVDKSENTQNAPHDYIQLEKPVRTRYLRITNVYCPSGKFSVSGFRVFGKMNKKLPAQTHFVKMLRKDSNRRSIKLRWDKVEGTTGYNIRYGSGPDKLYHNYTVYKDTEVEINSLHAGWPYYFTIDTFNEGGITKGTEVTEVL